MCRSVKMAPGKLLRTASCEESWCRPPRPLSLAWPSAFLPCSCGKEADVSPYFIILTSARFTREDQNPSGNGDAYKDIYFHGKCFLHFFKK